MRQTTFRIASALAIAASLLAACALPKLSGQSAPAERPAAQSAATPPDQPTEAGSPIPPSIAPGAGLVQEQPVHSAQKGAMERFDCLTGTPDWHARIAFEAQGGQVLGFAYYSKWKPRTCSIEIMRDTAGSKWYKAADGAVRVDSPQGKFLIRTSADAYVFEFANVQRRKFCGMPGVINGTMTIKRAPGKPQCSAVGIMDTNDPYLDSLYKVKK